MNLEELMRDEELVKFLKIQGKKYMRYYGIHNYMEDEDFLQDMYIWIGERLHKYNEERSGITTFLTWYIKAFCSRIVQHSQFQQNKWYERANEVIMSQVINDEGNEAEDKFSYFGIEDNWDNTDNQMIIEQIKSHLSDIDRQALDLLLEGYNYKEVGKRVGRSLQWVRCQLMNRIRRVCKEHKIKREEI